MFVLLISCNFLSHFWVHINGNNLLVRSHASGREGLRTWSSEHFCNKKQNWGLFQNGGDNFSSPTSPCSLEVDRRLPVSCIKESQAWVHISDPSQIFQVRPSILMFLLPFLFWLVTESELESVEVWKLVVKFWCCWCVSPLGNRKSCC